MTEQTQTQAKPNSEERQAAAQTAAANLPPAESKEPPKPEPKPKAKAPTVAEAHKLATEALKTAQETQATLTEIDGNLAKLTKYVDGEDERAIANASTTPEGKPLSIIQALAAVKREVGHVGKEGKAPAIMGGYNFRGVDAVVNACAGPLARHDVVVAPEVLNIERNIHQATNGKAMMNAYVTVRFTFYGPAGDSISAVTIGEAADAGDKAHSKAMSVAYRIALLQTLTLPTDEPDPDMGGYERQGQQQGQQYQGQQDQQGPPPQHQQAAPAQDPRVVEVQRRFRSLQREGYDYIQSIWQQHATTADIPQNGPMATQPHQVDAVMAILAETEAAVASMAADQGGQEQLPPQ